MVKSKLKQSTSITSLWSIKFLQCRTIQRMIKDPIHNFPSNLVGSGLMESYGLDPLSFFELFYIGGILLTIMMLYLCFVSVWILPSNKVGMMDGYSKGEAFMSHFVIPEKSPLAGKSKKSVLAHLGLKSLEIVKVIRTKENAEDLEVAN